MTEVLYCNPFIVPKIIHEFKIIPLNRKRVEKCNKIIHRFIWSRKIEKLKVKRSVPWNRREGDEPSGYIYKKNIYLSICDNKT